MCYEETPDLKLSGHPQPFPLGHSSHQDASPTAAFARCGARVPLAATPAASRTACGGFLSSTTTSCSPRAWFMEKKKGSKFQRVCF